MNRSRMELYKTYTSPDEARSLLRRAGGLMMADEALMGSDCLTYAAEFMDRHRQRSLTRSF